MPKVEKMEDRRVFEYDGKKYAVRRPTLQEITKTNDRDWETMSLILKCVT